MQVGLSATRESQTSSASRNTTPPTRSRWRHRRNRGVGELNIGDTILPEVTETFEPIEVDEPTDSMVFQVNDGPMAGRSGGKFVTSRHLKDRLEREAIPTQVSHRAR